MELRSDSKCQKAASIRKYVQSQQSHTQKNVPPKSYWIQLFDLLCKFNTDREISNCVSVLKCGKNAFGGKTNKVMLKCICKPVLPSHLLKVLRKHYTVKNLCKKPNWGMVYCILLHTFIAYLFYFSLLTTD